MIVLVFSLAGPYVYILVKVKVIVTRVEKLITVVYHYNHACFCAVLIFYATLGGPSWFLPMVGQKAIGIFLFLLAIAHFGSLA